MVASVVEQDVAGELEKRQWGRGGSGGGAGEGGGGGEAEMLSEARRRVRVLRGGHGAE